MSSSKIFRLLYAEAGSDKNYQLLSTDISGFTWKQFPTNSQLGDLNISEGEALTAENIGGKLKDPWTQKGFSGAEGTLKASVPLSEINAYPTELLDSSYGTSEALNPTTVTVASVTVGEEQTGTYTGTSGDFADLDGLYFIKILNAAGENPRYTMAGLYKTDASWMTLGTETIIVTDVIHVLDYFNLNAIDTGYYHFIAQAPNGRCHLLQYCGLVTDINLDEASKLLESILNIKSLGKNDDNDTTAMQAALTAAFASLPCLNHDTALVTNISSVIKYDPSEFKTNVVVNPTQSVLTGSGLTNFKTEHKREKAIVTGNASTNGKIAIDEVSNSIKITISVYDDDMETVFRTALKNQTVFGLYGNDADYNLQYNFPYCKVSGVTNAVDNNGLHTVDFMIEANQYCQDNYSYIKGLM